MQPESDDALVARARAGDRDAFAELIDRYQSPLYNLALRMVRSREDAGDITQEAFLRAWEKLPTLRGAAFKGWLFQIGVNLCRDFFRRRQRFAQGEWEEASVIELRRAAADTEEQAEARERSRVIADCVGALPPDLRSALVLRDVSGFAYEEIAQVLFLPLGTVKSRIARARAQVQERLQLYPELFERFHAKGVSNAN